jgi:hypothetical protein
LKDINRHREYVKDEERKSDFLLLDWKEGRSVKKRKERKEYGAGGQEILSP